MAKTSFSDPEALRRRIRHIELDKVDGKLFVEVLLQGLALKNAAELSRDLAIAPAVVSRIRSSANQVTDHMLVGLHETYGLEIGLLKDLLACCAEADGEADGAVEALSKHPVFATQRRAPQAST